MTISITRGQRTFTAKLTRRTAIQAGVLALVFWAGMVVQWAQDYQAALAVWQ